MKPTVDVGPAIQKSKLPRWLKWFLGLFRGMKIHTGPVDIQLDHGQVPPARTGLDKPHRVTPPKTWGPLGIGFLALILMLPGCPGKIPLPDSDGDGIPDVIDPCPSNPDPTCVPEPEPPEAYDCENPPAFSGVVKVRKAIPNRYVTVLKQTREPIGERQIQDFALNFRGVSDVKALGRAFAASMTLSALKRVLEDPAVEFVQQDGVKEKILVWGLDRVDQRSKALDGKYEPGADCSGAHAFVVDTGCPTSGNLNACSQTHPDFMARFDPVCHTQVTFGGCTDQHGHASHVAGIIGGTKWGVCKGVTLHAERVLDQNGSGTDSGVIAGIRNVIAFKQANPSLPVVINMSLGGSPAPALDQATCDAIDAGISVAVAAGNSSEDARLSSPARVLQAITVGASDSSDSQAYFSNYGEILDLYAPGVDIESDTPTGGSATFSGTSMAAPHVAGGAAMLMAHFKTETPAQIRDRLVAAATKDALDGTGPGSPNLLLYVKQEGGGGGGLPPKGVLVGEHMIARTDYARLITVFGKPIDLNEMLQCCASLIPSATAVPRPSPLRVAGVEINTLWPCQGPEAQDYFRLKGRANAFGCRGGPFRTDETAEVDWAAIGGPYLLGPNGEWTSEWNPVYWETQRAIAWHALQNETWEFKVPVDTWGCKHDQNLGENRHYMLWPVQAIEDCGRRWHPEHERYIKKTVEELGCFGNIVWELDNEGMGVQGWNREWFQQVLTTIKQAELVACRQRITGTSVPGVGADFRITHDREPLLYPIEPNVWSLNNERNPAHPPAVDTGYFEEVRKRGLAWALWRNGWTDAELEDALARRKAVIDGGPPPVPTTCTLGTPTAREAEVLGKKPTIRVQRTTAGYTVAGVEPRAGKWISGTPVANFGKSYYCQEGMNWPDACANPPSPGPVAPEAPQAQPSAPTLPPQPSGAGTQSGQSSIYEPRK